MQLKLNITENSSLRSALFAVCLIALVCGCNQRRYKPAKWREMVQNTLPDSDLEQSGAGRTEWSTLPSPFDQTLPYRGGSTLPGRAGMWTLPNRGGSTLPFRGGGMNTLPGRGWSTLPRRGGPMIPRGKGMNTLPSRYPEYGQVPRAWNTLPARQPWGGRQLDRGGWTTLPSR